MTDECMQTLLALLRSGSCPGGGCEGGRGGRTARAAAAPAPAPGRGGGPVAGLRARCGLAAAAGQRRGQVGFARGTSSLKPRFRPLLMLYLRCAAAYRENYAYFYSHNPNFQPHPDSLLEPRPTPALHRLGFWKEPQALHWVPTPPASCHARVHGVLSAAASSGIACLHLASMLPVRLSPYVKRYQSLLQWVCNVGVAAAPLCCYWVQQECTTGGPALPASLLLFYLPLSTAHPSCKLLGTSSG